MKKIFVSLLSLVLMFSLSGCQSPQETLVKVGVSWAMSEEDSKEDEDIQAYMQAIEASGGQPVYMDQVTSLETAYEALEAVDCVVMAGGEDVSPALYGEEINENCEEINEDRDTSDYYLMKAVIEKDVPVLATCRGMQMLNVVCGGKLYQDLFTEYETEYDHRDRELIDFTYHPITVQENSLLAKAMVNGAGEYEVNSWHHQGIKELGKGLKVTATAPDGMIEAVELEGKKFVLGVQFHPEWHIVEETLECTSVFKALMDATK